MDAAAASSGRVPQVLLGLFISWQLLFLPAANYLALVPHGQPEEGELSDSRRGADQTAGAGALQKAINFAAGVTDAWACLTGQVQAWWLFAPDVPSTATFPVVELRWDDDADPAAFISPVRLRTILEPDDSQAYFRPPSSFDRLFHYEARLGLIVSNWSEQSFAENSELWRSAIKDRVRRQWRSIRAYLRWYVQYWQQAHAGLPPPKQVILLIHMYQTPGPGEGTLVWRGPVEQPLARWRPGRPAQEGELPIEVFDPIDRCFVVLKASSPE